MFYKIFTTHGDYHSAIKSMKSTDGTLGMLMFVMAMTVIIIFCGILHYSPLIMLFALAVVAVVFALLRRTSMQSMGLTLKNLGQSAGLGLAFGIIILVVNVVNALLASRHIATFGAMFGALYTAFLTALTHEILFRGYIQTRIYGLCKNDFLTILLGGVFYTAVMNIAFNIIGGGFLGFLKGGYGTIVYTILWHFAFVLMHRQYNNLAAPFVFHFFMIFSQALFA